MVQVSGGPKSQVFKNGQRGQLFQRYIAAIDLLQLVLLARLLPFDCIVPNQLLSARAFVVATNGEAFLPQ